MKEQIESDDLLFDQAIYRHSYAPTHRDYDVLVAVMAAKPSGLGSYTQGNYRYRFTHCPHTSATTKLTNETWRASWDDLFTDYESWGRAGHPEGFVWAQDYAVAYPGLSYVDDSSLAEDWTRRLGQPMHEVVLETNVFELRLVCHGLRVDQTAWGDPETGKLVDAEGRKITD